MEMLNPFENIKPSKSDLVANELDGMKINDVKPVCLNGLTVTEFRNAMAYLKNRKIDLRIFETKVSQHDGSLWVKRIA